MQDEIYEEDFSFDGKFLKGKNILKNVKSVDYLFIGDSWMEYWTRSDLMGGGTPVFSEEVKELGLDAINIGVGGTEFIHWIPKVKEFIKDANPKKIVVCLGGNDLAHGTALDRVCEDFATLMTEIHKYLPTTTVYISTVWHSKCSVKFWEDEEKLNEFMKDFSKTHDYVKVFANDDVIFKNGNLVDNVDEYYLEDDLHLTRKGYDLWGKALLEEIQK